MADLLPMELWARVFSHIQPKLQQYVVHKVEEASEMFWDYEDLLVA